MLSGARSSNFYSVMGVVAIVLVFTAFSPSLFFPSARRAPLTLLAGIHATLTACWLLLFVVQCRLVATRRIAAHRRLGTAAAALAIALVATGYQATVVMTRRGFDLSGDLGLEPSDVLANLVFPLGDLLSFSLLVSLGYWYRRRSDIHRRLMLLATTGSLMAAPLAHLIGHFNVPGAPAVILIPMTCLFMASAVHDRIAYGRVHRVSLWGGLGLLMWAQGRAAFIGPSTAWHQAAEWLVR